VGKKGQFNAGTGEPVRIFDTTLRDGEQSPGASLTVPEKLKVAGQLATLGVDIIEAGFPAASPGDLDAVRSIAGEVGRDGGPVIAGLARATPGDIEKAWTAVQTAARPRIHTFLATSDLHMERKLGMTREEVLRAVAEMVAYARGFCSDVEFSPEDATRSDPVFLTEVLAAAIEAGATTLNIPDTVGYAMPGEYGELMRSLIHGTAGGEGVIWSVHCHDDLGFATANTIAGIQAGARQAEVTVNGIGERAGNASLEEVVMALHTRRDRFGLTTGIDTARLVQTSRIVSNFTGIQVPPNKAVVGPNAFAHEAGIHQDGILKDQRTYEIMRPETVGLARSRLVLGKHSGRHAFRVRMEELGFSLDDQELKEAFTRFKELADLKKTVTDADLAVLARQQFADPEAIYGLKDLQVACGQPGLSTATVRLEGPGGARAAAAIGAGPVDAAFRAIDQLVGVDATLIEYDVHSVTAGIDALGEVTVRIREKDQEEGRIFGGYGADTDIIAASAQAYMAALNRLLAARGAIPESGVGAGAGRPVAPIPVDGRPGLEKARPSLETGAESPPLATREA
jgi:2-isopropylmalate synthase